MSGENVAVLAALPDGTLARLIKALAALENDGLPTHALVGGVAVMVRLSQAHRATQDLDEVVEPSSPTASVLIGGEGSPEHRTVTPEGVRVDLIAVGDRPIGQLAADELPDDDAQRLQLLAHDHALRTAAPAAIRVVDPAGALVVETITPVATAAALFATKLQAAPGRSGPTLLKRGSDLYDAFLLLDQLGPRTVADGLIGGPHDLPRLVGRLAARLLDEQAERSMRWAAEAGVDGPAAGMTAAAARALAADLVPLLAG